MSDQVRVLHAIGSLNIGGSQAFVMNLYRNIDRSKIQFDFVIEHPGELHYADEIRDMGGRIIELHPFTGGNYFSYRRQWNSLLSGSTDWSILHSHVRSTASIYLPLAKRRGLKTVIHSHSTSEASGFKGSVKRVLEYPLRKVADYHFACSEEAARWLFGDALVDRGDALVLPNAIDVKKFAYSSDARRKIRDDLGIASDEKIIGSVGRIVHSKNYLNLVEALAPLLREDKGRKLLLVGDGPLLPQIRECAEKERISGQVLLPGSVSNVPNYLSAMDVFTFPSLYEGFGNVLIEAQCSGLPCIASDAVPKSTQLTGLVQYAPLTDGAPLWASDIAKLLEEGFRSRTGYAQIIADKGFDIESLVNMLTDFYMSVVKS